MGNRKGQKHYSEGIKAQIRKEHEEGASTHFFSENKYLLCKNEHLLF